MRSHDDFEFLYIKILGKKCRKIFLLKSLFLRKYEKIFCMDRVDRKILSLLQEDARITTTALADRSGISISAAHRRLKELESREVITGYRTMVDPRAVGLQFQALVFVTMRDGAGKTLQQLEAAVKEIDEVVVAHRLSGDPDYILQVITADVAAYGKLYDTKLANLPGVQRLSTTLIMSDIVPARGLNI